MTDIPFNRPYLTGREIDYILSSHASNQLAGDGPFTKQCHTWLETKTAGRALLTHSCTAALEMAAILMNIVPGDEIIMPSYTFVSTANAFVLRGGIPVFVDIRADTLNLDETLIEAAITPRTRAIVPVHYAGVACEMDAICSIASRHGITVIEDAAQGLMAKYNGRALGGLGALGTFSFHETKNIISGEGGALIVNDAELSERAEIIREKGTDRSRFFRGEVDKYSWQDIGSSYLPGELISAFLWAQFESADSITNSRLQIWNRYHSGLLELESAGCLRRPIIPPHCEHNGHMYYILLKSSSERDRVIAALKQKKINSVFHYVPLHSSDAGRRFGRTQGGMSNTDRTSDTLLRLPLWIGLTPSDQARIIHVLTDALT